MFVKEAPGNLIYNHSATYMNRNIQHFKRYGVVNLPYCSCSGIYYEIHFRQSFLQWFKSSDVNTPVHM